MKKIAFITGANKGIGFETAQELAKNGIKVIVGARNEERGKNAVKKIVDQGFEAEFIQLDLSDANSIKNAVTMVQSEFDRIDILINNAGIIHQDEDWQVNTVESISSDILKQTFETNFFGLVNFTQQMLPLIKNSEAGSIINVSSILGSLEIGNDTESIYYTVKPFAYNASKAALNSFTIHLAAALKEDNIKVNSAHPGWVRTDLGTEHAPLSVEEGAKTIVDMALDSSDATARFIHLGEELAW